MRPVILRVNRPEYTEPQSKVHFGNARRREPLNAETLADKRFEDWDALTHLHGRPLIVSDSKQTAQKLNLKNEREEKPLPRSILLPSAIEFWEVCSSDQIHIWSWLIEIEIEISNPGGKILVSPGPASEMTW